MRSPLLWVVYIVYPVLSSVTLISVLLMVQAVCMLFLVGLVSWWHPNLFGRSSWCISFLLLSLWQPVFVPRGGGTRPQWWFLFAVSCELLCCWVEVFREGRSRNFIFTVQVTVDSFEGDSVSCYCFDLIDCHSWLNRLYIVSCFDNTDCCSHIDSFWVSCCWFFYIIQRVL